MVPLPKMKFKLKKKIIDPRLLNVSSSFISGLASSAFPCFLFSTFLLAFSLCFEILTLLAVRLTRNYQSLFMGEGGADMCSNSQCASLKTVQAPCSFKIRQNKSLILLDRLSSDDVTVLYLCCPIW